MDKREIRDIVRQLAGSEKVSDSVLIWDRLLVAMETADVEIGYKGFRKCKRYEKYKETDSDASDKGSVPYQQRTDITDAWDVLYLGCRHFTLRMSGICLPRSG